MASVCATALILKVVSKIHITHARVITNDCPMFGVRLNICVEASQLEYTRKVIMNIFQADRIYFMYEDV